MLIILAKLKKSIIFVILNKKILTMKDYFKLVKNYLLDSDIQIDSEDETDEIFVVSKAEAGISNLVIGCAYPILILEQHILEIQNPTTEILKKLLMKNREIISGAFVLDESGRNVIFRKTLEIENLDFNEIYGVFNSLSMLLSEYSAELIQFSKS